MVKLSPERVLDGAMTLADEIGIEAFTIRRLADTLNTKPMSIYHHIASKEAIIDGMVNRVFTEITLPSPDAPWREAIAIRARSMREVLGRHPWATALLDSRTEPGDASLAHHDRMIGCLRNAGFTTAMVGHIMALLDSYVYGFALQEAALPATAGADVVELAEHMMAPLDPGQYPNLVAFAAEQVMTGEYDFGDEFEFGLNLILDGFDGQLA